MAVPCTLPDVTVPSRCPTLLPTAEARAHWRHDDRSTLRHRAAQPPRRHRRRTPAGLPRAARGGPHGTRAARPAGDLPERRRRGRTHCRSRQLRLRGGHPRPAAGADGPGRPAVHARVARAAGRRSCSSATRTAPTSARRRSARSTRSSPRSGEGPRAVFTSIDPGAGRGRRDGVVHALPAQGIRRACPGRRTRSAATPDRGA